MESLAGGQPRGVLEPDLDHPGEVPVPPLQTRDGFTASEGGGEEGRHGVYHRYGLREPPGVGPAELEEAYDVVAEDERGEDRGTNAASREVANVRRPGFSRVGGHEAGASLADRRGDRGVIIERPRAVGRYRGGVGRSLEDPRGAVFDAGEHAHSGAGVFSQVVNRSPKEHLCAGGRAVRRVLGDEPVEV